MFLPMALGFGMMMYTFHFWTRWASSRQDLSLGKRTDADVTTASRGEVEPLVGS